MRINSNNYPLVSVIMNCYDGESYLAEAVKSVLNQNFNNYEHIILDSCSNDGTSQVLKKFRSNKINYERKADKGIYFALNRSISKAKGEYIINLHAGDFFCSDSILKKLDSTISNYKNIDFFFSNIGCMHNL